MTVQELLKAAQQLSVSEQIQLADEIKRLAKQTPHLTTESDSALSEASAAEDPIVGLFAGSPDLATNAKDILDQEVTSTSGFTWKAL